MTELLFKTCFFLFDLIDIIVQGLIIIILFNKKTDFKRIMLFGAINSFAMLMTNFVNPKYVLHVRLILYITVMILTIKFILSTSFFVSVVGTGIILIFSAVLEYICMALNKLFFLSSFSSNNLVFKSFVSMLTIRSITTIILIATLGTLYYAKMEINVTDNISIKKMLGLVMNIVVVSVLIIPNIIISWKALDDISLSVIIFNAVILLALVLVNLYNAKKFIEFNMQKRVIERQKQSIDTLTDVIDGLRGIKHDFNNIVNVISGYIALDDFEGFKKYFRQLQNSCWTISNVTILNDYIKSDPAIYGLLLSKISAAKTKDISFNINCSTEIEIRHMKSIEIYRIIGILLDNAFEAAEETEDKYVEFLAKKLNNDEGILIEVINSISKNIDINKIYLDGFSTKGGHAGFGLWEVKKIISKYNESYLNTFINNNLFTQQLKIY